MGVLSLLSPHLPLLEGRNSVLRIEDNNLTALHITKAFHGSLSGISGGGGENHNLLLNLILFTAYLHKVGKNGQCHIFESQGSSVEELQIVAVSLFYYRGDFLCRKLIIIGRINAVA